MLYNLKAMKAGAASNTVNSGIRNVFGGLGTLAAGYKPSGGQQNQTQQDTQYI